MMSDVSLTAEFSITFKKSIININLGGLAGGDLIC